MPPSTMLKWAMYTLWDHVANKLLVVADRRAGDEDGRLLERDSEEREAETTTDKGMGRPRSSSCG